MSDLIDRLEQLIRPCASTLEVKPMHWISGGDWDEAISYCPECAIEQIAFLKKEDPQDYYLGGGYPVEVDSFPVCDLCDCFLEANFLTSLCEDEFTSLEDNFDIGDPLDCRILSEILSVRPDELNDRINIFAIRLLGTQC